MLSVSLTGFCCFYLIPFVLSFTYSLVDNPVSGQFCGLQNYKELFQNTYFLRGLKNTAWFMAVSIPLNMALSLGMALVVRRTRGSSGTKESSRVRNSSGAKSSSGMKDSSEAKDCSKMNRCLGMEGYSDYLSLIFLIPLAIPSATSAFFWEKFFGLHGTLNRFLSLFHVEGIDWLDSSYGMAVMVVIFIWKNIGYDMALFISGLSSIPEEYYECADAEGAGRLWKFKNITLTYLTPTLFLVLIMTFVNSFKVFREIYIITGEYPPDSLYVLQHYMNNMFLSLNYSRLVSATYVLTAAVVLFVVCVFRGERKVSENLHD